MGFLDGVGVWEKSECDGRTMSHGGSTRSRSIRSSIICLLLPSVLLAFLVLLSAFMPQTGCSAIWHFFLLYFVFFFRPTQLSGACRLGGFK